jgi:hypothetical protein
MRDVMRDGVRIKIPQRISIMRCDDGIVLILNRETTKEFGVLLAPNVAMHRAH